MLALIGVLLLAAWLLLDRWAYNQFRQPNPPAWTRGNVRSQLAIGLVLLVMFAGPSCLLYAVLHRAELDFGLVHGLLSAAVVAATAVAYRALLGQWRRLAAEGPALHVVDGDGPRPASGAGGGRKAA